MRTKDQLYNSLLRIQAELSYSMETTLLRKTQWDKAQTVLDYGCGNAYFLELLSNKYPEKTYYCCDRNERILEFVNKQKGFHVYCGEYPNINFGATFDFFILRHLTSYLSNRKNFFKWLSVQATEKAGILLIDAFDENLIIEPKMPVFQSGLDKFYNEVKDMGGNRDVLGNITSELSDVGFMHKDTLKIVVNSNDVYLKEKLFVYMSLVAELDNGLPLEEQIREELMDWVTNEKSYVQYGLFASIFERISL